MRHEGDYGSIGSGPFFLVKMWKYCLEHNCRVLGYSVPMLMMHSILKKASKQCVVLFTVYYPKNKCVLQVF